jgi:hypothetical protein
VKQYDDKLSMLDKKKSLLDQANVSDVKVSEYYNGTPLINVILQ